MIVCLTLDLVKSVFGLVHFAYHCCPGHCFLTFRFIHQVSQNNEVSVITIHEFLISLVLFECRGVTIVVQWSVDSPCQLLF